MRKRTYILSAFLFLVFITNGQEKTKAYRFHSVNSIGLLNGSNGVWAALQSVNGFQKKNWFVGLGAGLDYYYYRTVPVFADVRYSFGKKKNKFFAYADGGINIDWAENYINYDIAIRSSAGNQSHLSNGMYTDAGLGYLIKIKKENALALSVSYSNKTLKETVTTRDWRTQKLQTDFNTYSFNRILIKVGWQF